MQVVAVVHQMVLLARALEVVAVGVTEETTVAQLQLLVQRTPVAVVGVVRLLAKPAVLVARGLLSFVAWIRIPLQVQQDLQQ